MDNTKPNEKPTEKQVALHKKKVEMATNFLLELYKAITGNTIDKLEDFKELRYNDFMSKDGLKVFDNMKGEMFLYFSKGRARFSSFDKIKNYNLNFTKFLCKELGCELKSTRKNIVADGKIKMDTSYHIDTKNMVKI